MVNDYNPLPDLAELLASAIAYRGDAHVYADRIASHLGLGEDDSAEVVTAVLRERLGLTEAHVASVTGDAWCRVVEHDDATRQPKPEGEYRRVDVIDCDPGRFLEIGPKGADVLAWEPGANVLLRFGGVARDQFMKAFALAEMDIERSEAARAAGAEER